jgi:hypothetical protein
MDTLSECQKWTHENYLHYKFVLYPTGWYVIPTVMKNSGRQCQEALAYRQRPFYMEREMPMSFLIYTRFQKRFFEHGGRSEHQNHAFTVDEYKIVLDELYTLISKDSI